MDDDGKFCSKCGLAKPLSEFYRSPGMRDGHRNDCIKCNLEFRKQRYNSEEAVARTQQWRKDNPERFQAWVAEYRNRPERKRKQRDTYYRRTFGITADDVDALIEKQGGVCVICGRTPERLASWHVDHCHETGVVRGILCIDCNQGIGKFHEDPARLRAAADYLESTSR
jgi:hypothetical protein